MYTHRSTHIEHDGNRPSDANRDLSKATDGTGGARIVRCLPITNKTSPISQAGAQGQAHSEQNKAQHFSECWSLQRSPVEASGAYGAGTGLYFFLFPNTMLNIMPGRVQTNRVVPISKDSCQVEFDFYYAPDAVERAAADAEFSDEVQEEDRLICERVQKGLQSGVYEPGRLSPRRESGVWHFHTWLRQVYDHAGL